jgi:hypothetical protein
MWSIALKAVLGFAGRYAQPLLIAALLALVGLYAKGGYDNWKLKRAVAAAEQRADKALAGQRDAERRFDELVRDYNEQARAADEREREIERRRLANEASLRNDYETRRAADRRITELALDGLRHSADADRRRALQAAGSAPPDCRNYAADPRNLSVHDSELLVRIGAAAEAVAGSLAYCDGFVSRVVPRSEGSGK